MSRPEEPPSWAGARAHHPDESDVDETHPGERDGDAAAPDDEPPRPGYQRAEHLPPHAPMPGAPPYPAAEPPPPVAPRSAERRRRWWRR